MKRYCYVNVFTAKDIFFTAFRHVGLYTKAHVVTLHYL